MVKIYGGIIELRHGVWCGWDIIGRKQLGRTMKIFRFQSGWGKGSRGQGREDNKILGWLIFNLKGEL